MCRIVFILFNTFVFLIFYLLFLMVLIDFTYLII